MTYLHLLGMRKDMGENLVFENLVSIEEAADLVSDGQNLALGGMTLYRRPIGFVKALLRRRPRPRDLTLLSFTGGLESDLLIGAGCVRQVRSAYFGLESFGLAPMFTQFVQSGRIKVIEETEASIVMGCARPSPAWDSCPRAPGWERICLPCGPMSKR